MSTFGVVIPAYNEEAFVGRVVDAVAAQVDGRGAGLLDQIHLVVVDNGSTDGTAAVLVAAGEAHPALRLSVRRLPHASMIGARREGWEFLEVTDPCRYVVSLDADTFVPPTWLWEIGQCLETADVASAAGYFPASFWRRCPRLTERYVTEVGTIYFDPDTVQELGLTGDGPLFTARLCDDFGRMPSDPGFAFRRDAVEQVGGYPVDHWDDGRTRPIHALAWPLALRAASAGLVGRMMARPWFTNSERRLVGEIEKFVTGASYEGDIVPYRVVDDRCYDELDRRAGEIDFALIRRAVVKNGVLLPVLCDPSLVHRNEAYFEEDAGPLFDAVRTWRRMLAEEGTRDALRQAEVLYDTFGAAVTERIRAMAPAVTA